MRIERAQLDPAPDDRVASGELVAAGNLFPKGRKGLEIMKSPSFFGWYRMLRAHYQWTVFEAIPYALRLTRSRMTS